MKTKSADGQIPEEVPVEEEKSGPAEFHLKESLGSQVLKRFHEDHSALMQQYDEILPVLDHSDVKAFLEEKLKGWEKDLTHVEKSHKKWFKDVEPIAGSMDEAVDEMEGEVEDKDHLPGEIDNAGNADSDPVEEPTPDEAMEGMEAVDDDESPEEKALRIKQTKSIRSKYRGKSDKKDDEDKEEKDMPTTDEPLADAEAEVDGVKWFKGLAEHQQGHVTEAKGYLKELGETPDEGFTHEHRMKAYHHGTNLEGIEGKAEVMDEVAGDVPVDGTKSLNVGDRVAITQNRGGAHTGMTGKIVNYDQEDDKYQVSFENGAVNLWCDESELKRKSIQTKDLTEGEADKIKDEMLEQAADNVQKSLRKAVKNAGCYLKELAGSEQFGEDQRQKAMSLCKDLEEIEAEEKAEETADVPPPEDEGAMETKTAEEIEELKEKAIAREKQMDELTASLKRLEGLVK